MDGGEMYFDGSGYYRLFPFITGSHTIDVVETPEQAGEAAIQFGRFTRLMMGLDPMQLHETIPGFHDLGLRYEQYLHAVRNGNRRRVLDAEDLVKKIGKHSGIVNDYIGIRKNPEFKLRVTHHDTKISNVLFDEKDRGLCVIDMDTVMPGYFFSDVGDMMRTYLSPVSEEETDLAKITVREEFYRAIVRGYLAEMGAGLTAAEKNHIYFSGSFMIYMQAIRFLTDHFNDDAYYGARYPGHNFNRAANQVELLEKYLEMAFLRSE
jgi:Ser/Thr protein kinase RdoA (MazF antagonist)